MRVLFAWFTVAIVSAPSATFAQNLGSAVATNGREAFERSGKQAAANLQQA